MGDFSCVAAEMGSSRVKAAVFGGGVKESSCSRTVGIHVDGVFSEFDPDLQVSALFDSMVEALGKSGRKSVDAVCVSSFGPVSVFLDSSLKPARMAVSCLDSRAGEEAGCIFRESGRFVPPSFIAPVTLWVKRHEPSVFSGVAWVVQLLDYAASVLVGSPSRAVLSDDFTPFPEFAWKAAGLDGSLLPPAVRTGDPLGGLCRKAASRLGLREGTPVYAGTGGADVAENLLGSACLSEGVACDKTGTTEGIEIVSSSRIEDPRFFTARHPFLPGKWHSGAVMSSGGRVFEWFLRSFYGPSASFEDMTREAESAPPGSGGLVFLPYLAGERCPVFDPSARGVFFGLSEKHGRPHMARAVMEGVVYAMSGIMDMFAGHGVRPSLVRGSGLPSGNRLLNRIKADVLGLPYQPALDPEPELVGVAAIAMTAAGLFGSFAEASESMVSFADTVEPSENGREEYEKGLSVYRRLYPSLKPLFPR